MMISLLRWFFGVPVKKKPVNTIEQTVAQHRQALNTIDHRLSDVEGRLHSGEVKVNARLRALEYRKDVISRDPPDSADR